MFLYKKFVNKDAGTELDDIRRNLGYLLRTKRGCGTFQEAFGINETGYRTPADMVENLSNEIRETVERYEPRIEIIEIDEEHESGGSVTLAVHCRVRSTDERLQIMLNTSQKLVDIGGSQRDSDE